MRRGSRRPGRHVQDVYDPKSQHAFAILFENIDHTGRYASGRTFDYIQATGSGIGDRGLDRLNVLSGDPDRVRRQMKPTATDVEVPLNALARIGTPDARRLVSSGGSSQLDVRLLTTRLPLFHFGATNARNSSGVWAGTRH